MEVIHGFNILQKMYLKTKVARNISWCCNQTIFRSFSKSIPIFKGLNPNWGSKKHLDKRKIKLSQRYQPLGYELNQKEILQQLEPLKVQVKEQGIKVRNLKSSKGPEEEINNEIQILKDWKKELESLTEKLAPADPFDRARMADLIKRRFFYDSSFSIYGGFAGQYDYGPMGCQVVDNLLAEWHRHFVIREKMLKVHCSSLTPEPVLRASGHVDKFTDFIVKDEVTGECFRLDHLIKHRLEEVLAEGKGSPDEEAEMRGKLALLDGMTMAELSELSTRLGLTSPSTSNPLSPPSEINLMFPVAIGPTGTTKGFLRPETAQGIFTNFRKLLEYNQGKLPFACAQVGSAFRNEISPKSGLLRLREFTLAEIEHFCFQDQKAHPKFAQVRETRMWLYSACHQRDGEEPREMSIGEAVHQGMVANETLGYYLARIHQFLMRIGLNPRKVRYRQHLSNEMAHYAQDCWDAECLTSYGWTECVGCADRSAFDLAQHAKVTGVDMRVERTLSTPRVEEGLSIEVDKRKVKKTFGSSARSVLDELDWMDTHRIREMDIALRDSGRYALRDGVIVTREMVPSVTEGLKETSRERVLPCVVEPSFGIGRIFYALLEHSFSVRPDDDKRTYFALPPPISPVKLSVLPLVPKAEFVGLVRRLADDALDLDLSAWVDDSRGTIGRRYVRMDEMSVPFCATVDETTVTSPDNTVTLRERDTTLQVRIPMAEVASTVKRLSEGKLTWQEVTRIWGGIGAQETS